MGKNVSAIVVLLSMIAMVVGIGWLKGFDFGSVALGTAPSAVLTPAMDSEKLLYDDAFMDEAIMTYSLRSLTASMSRLGQARGIDCHDRAHEMGRRAYELLGGESFKNCGIECHSGCRHGATEAFFAEHGTADLVGSMEILCGDEAGNQFHMHQCIHGIGHGLMAWYDYELHEALKACDMIAHSFHQDSCYSGVFMENIVGSISRRGERASSGHHTEYLSDDPHYPCNAIAERYQAMCYWLQTDRMLDLFDDVDAVGVACAEVPEPLQFSCFFSMGRTISGHFVLDPVKSYEVCTRVAHTAGGNWCLEGALSNLMWDVTQADGAVAFCALALGTLFEEVCYRNLIVRGAEVVPSGGMHDFCGLLPERYRDSCLSQEVSASFPLTASDTSAPFVAAGKMEDPVIRYVDGAYVPDTVHVSVGDRVVWVNEDPDQLFWPASNIHPTHAAYPGSDIKKCATADKDVIFDACEALPYGKEYSFVFTRVGQWRFHDHVNPRATGTVIVSE